MPRVSNTKKKSKKPLRGSVRQNTMQQEDEESSSWFNFELSFGMRLTLMVAAALFLIGSTALIWRSGWPRRQYYGLIESSIDLTRKANFAIKDISVEGRFYTDPTMLTMAIGAKGGSPIITFDPQETLERIKQLPWIESATVERRLPDTIHITITERKPMARWQMDNQVSVIDKKGAIIRDALPESFSALPLVVGPDAPQKTEELLGFIQNFKFITESLKAAVRVGERRWDLYLSPKIIIRLPEKDVVAALMRLDQLVREKKVLDYQVATIDLRIADRMIVEPMAEDAKSTNPAPPSADFKTTKAPASGSKKEEERKKTR